MSKPLIFTVDVKSIPKKLFSIQEKASGDLTIIVKGTKFSTTIEGADSTPNDAIVEERYSVHKSPESRTVNVIKYTRVIIDGTRMKARNFTKALKITKRLAPIYIYRCADLSDSRYNNIAKSTNRVSLGKYEPNNSQLIYMVLVAPPTFQFTVPQYCAVNCLETTFSEFKIVVLWQFLAIDSKNTSRGLTLITFDDPHISNVASPFERDSKIAAALGYSSDEAIANFHDLKQKLATMMLEAVFDKKYDEPVFEDFKRAAARMDLFFRSGVAGWDYSRRMFLFRTYLMWEKGWREFIAEKLKKIYR